MTHPESARAKEVIRYKDLTAELTHENYRYKWYCPECQVSTWVNGSYTFDEVLERGQIWLIQLYKYWKEKCDGD